MTKEKVLKLLAIAELLIAAVLILFDVLLPTVLVLVLAGLSLLVRKEKVSELGLKKAPRPWRMAGIVLLLSIGWTLVDFCIILPALNHLTGTYQDMSGFDDLKRNAGQWLVLLAASWTLAALGEEIVYRGYLQHRIAGLFGNEKAGIMIAVVFSSVLFGFAHTEQGIVGIVVTALDAVFFSVVRLKFGNNTWASVLAHGFNNTIGITVFFFTGPLYGLW